MQTFSESRDTALDDRTRLAASILDALPSHVALVDADGVIGLVNRAWRDFACQNGYCGDTFWVGANYLSTCRSAYGPWSDEAGPVETGLRSVLHGLTDRFELEYPCHSPSEQRWFRMAITPLPVAGRRGAVVMHVNITERVLAELATKQARERTQALLDTTVDAILLVDDAGRVLSNNAPALALFGGDVVGRTVADLLPGTRWRGLPEHVETVACRSTGEPVPVDLAVRELAEGATRQWSLTIRDITAQKLRQAERAAELQGLQRLSGRDSVLEQDDPAAFAALVQDYGRLLDLTLERLAMRVEHDVAGELRRLGQRLAALEASPRDVVSMHVQAVQNRSRGVLAAKAQAYLQEGRLLVLELMGNVAAAYRALAVSKDGAHG